MRKIDKTPEPDFWKEFKRKNPNVKYQDLDKVNGGEEVRRRLREYMLTNQFYLCAYCCNQLDIDNSLNEHIKPQQAYPNNTMDYENLIVSCKNAKTCGSLKDNNYNPNLFISPLDEDCESYFSFAPDGEIHIDNDKGEYTVDLLGLNSHKLKEARKAKYKSCEWCDAESIKWFLEPKEGKLDKFVDIIEYFYKKGYYSE